MFHSNTLRVVAVVFKVKISRRRSRRPLLICRLSRGRLNRTRPRSLLVEYRIGPVARGRLDWCQPLLPLLLLLFVNLSRGDDTNRLVAGPGKIGLGSSGNVNFYKPERSSRLGHPVDRRHIRSPAPPTIAMNSTKKKSLKSGKRNWRISKS